MAGEKLGLMARCADFGEMFGKIYHIPLPYTGLGGHRDALCAAITDPYLVP